MRSKLPRTGKCYGCGEPCHKLYCDRSCAGMYRRATINGKRVRMTEKKLTPKRQRELIDDVVQRAKDEGTYYGCQLAPVME